MKDYTIEPSFWERLESFVGDVQTGCCMGEEEKQMILRVCRLKQQKNNVDTLKKAIFNDIKQSCDGTTD